MPNNKGNPCVLLPGVWKSYVLLMNHAMSIVTERLEKECQQRDISTREGWILMAAEEKTCSQQFIAYCLGINNNVMVGLVDGLEKKKLICRKRNPNNRREYLLQLAPKGRKLLEWIHEGFAERTRRIFFPVPLEVLEEHVRAYSRAVIDSYYEGTADKAAN